METNASSERTSPAGPDQGTLSPPVSAKATAEYIERLERTLAGEREKNERLQRKIAGYKKEAFDLAAKFALNPKASSLVNDLKRENAALRRKLEDAGGNVAPRPRQAAGRTRSEDRLAAILRETYPAFYGVEH